MTESSFHLIINKYKMMIALFLIICMNDCIIFMGCMRFSGIMIPLPSTVHDSQFVHGAKRLLHLTVPEWYAFPAQSLSYIIEIYVITVLALPQHIAPLSSE